jgi:hypothetical protein
MGLTYDYSERDDECIGHRDCWWEIGFEKGWDKVREEDGGQK